MSIPSGSYLPSMHLVWWRISLSIFCPFIKLSCFIFLWRGCKTSTYSGYNSFIRYVFYKYFLLMCSLSFYFFAVFFKEQMFLILMKSIFANFFLDSSRFLRLKKVFSNPRSQRFSSMFSSRRFTVFFQKVLHLGPWSIFVACTCYKVCSMGSSWFLSFDMDVQLLHLFQTLSFLHWIILAPLLKIHWSFTWGLLLTSSHVPLDYMSVLLPTCPTVCPWLL